ncbi:hypothetical protein BGX26_011148 [Mortierella sp. AD094]|nr:hypothetical protein BGX26_011148 [Mortierella sp. AD094]
MFTSAHFAHIRISLSGYHSFTLPVTLQRAAKYASNICSIDSPHPSFAPLLLEAIADTGHAEPWFPNLASLSVSFDQDVFRFLRPPIVQPRFLYPSDSEDDSDNSYENIDSEVDHNNTNAVATWDPTKGIYSTLWARAIPLLGVTCPTQDPYEIIRLVRQCPNLTNLKIQVRTLGNMVGLYHLFWPGILPQSIERLEIIVPNYWNEESYENSLDEDYDPSLNPIRDVEEEYEEDSKEDTLMTDPDDGYNEDEIVDWYRSAIQLPEYPEFFASSWPQYFGDAPRQPLLNLREIAITNTEQVRNVVLSFIENSCPHLRSMHLINPSDHFCHNFVLSSDRITRELENLKIEIRDDISEEVHFDQEFMNCALGAAQWKSISIKNYFDYGSQCIYTLLRRTPTIEVLDLGVNAGSLRSGFIQRFLAAAPRLRAFTGEALYFLAQFAVRQPWACAESLEVFRCQILLEIPLIDSSIEPPPTTGADERLMITEVGDIVEVDQADQADVVFSHEELQRRAMEQLGRCHQLQELDLSHWKPHNGEIRGPYGLVLSAPGLMLAPGDPVNAYNNSKKYSRVNANVHLPWVMKSQRKCLQFTFETGLRELEDLKDLRKLDLTGLNHRISVEELKWMRGAWPQLEQFDGLFNDNNNFDDEEYEAREERRKRDEEMRDWLTRSVASEGDCTFWRTSRLD